MSGPPPPPPLGAFSARPPQMPPNFTFQRPPMMHPGPPMGGPGPQQQIPMPTRPKIESTHTVDLRHSPPVKMDDAAYRKKLTSYEVHSLRKSQPTGKEKSTWAKVEHSKEPLSQDDIATQLKMLKGSPKTVADKKAALYPWQQQQVNNLLDTLNNDENDQHFHWSLVQLDRREKTSKGVRETVLITVIVMRTVKDDLRAQAIYEALERRKEDRAAALNRPPMPPPQPQPTQPPQHMPPQHMPPPHMPPPHMPPPHMQPQHGHGGPPGPPPPQVVNDHRSNSRIRKPKYHSESDSESDFDSDTASSTASTMSSSFATSISSRSGGRSRRHNSRGRRGRSHSKHREHQKEYYNVKRESPEPPRFAEARRSSIARPHIVESPPSPRALPSPAPAPADTFAEGVKVGRELERERTANRYLAQRPLIVNEPSALTITGPNERHYVTQPRYLPRRYEEVPEPRYIEPRARYPSPPHEEHSLDDLFEEDISVRRFPRDEMYSRRILDAENYMHRDPAIPRIRYTGARPQIPHPFAPRAPPRRYASSYSSGSSY